MRSSVTAQSAPRQTTSAAPDLIALYATTQTAELAAICRALRTEIEAALPRSTGKIWHGSPVWFIGENPVVGYHVTAHKRVSLLFWNGQKFDEPALVALGKFHGAQTVFATAAEIDVKVLRRWLQRSATTIWDYRGFLLAQKALRRKAKP